MAKKRMGFHPRKRMASLKLDVHDIEWIEARRVSILERGWPH